MAKTAAELIKKAVQIAGQGKPDEARKLLLESLSIEKTHTAYLLLAQLDFRQQKWQSSFDNYNQAVKLNNQDAFAYRELGRILYLSKKYDLAIPNLLRSLELDPKQIETNFFLGLCLNALNQHLAAISCFEAEARINPKQTRMFTTYGECLSKIGKITEGVKQFKYALDQYPTTQGYSALMHMVHHDPTATNETFRQYAIECYERCLLPFKKSVTKKFDNFDSWDFSPKKRLRIGFISWRFRYFAADYWTLNIFNNMNRDDFEIVLYHYSNFEDEVTQKFRDTADRWQDLYGKKPEEMAEIIHSDKLDILVDLIGHMGSGCLEAMCLKPAPIQVAWLNYYGTMGMPEYDYTISDQHIMTDEIEKTFVEKVYKLPHYFCPLIPKGQDFDLPISGTLPQDANGYITFGSLNRFQKVNELVLEFWSAILNAVPNSKILVAANVFKEKAMVDYITNFFTKRGVEASRLILEDYPEIKEFFLMFNRIDMHLEAFPFVSATTSLDAAYMGVPTVTFEGPTWVHRSAIAIMNDIGCAELIAKDKEDCLNKTIALANDKNRLLNYRKSLRSQVMNSAICDYPLFAKNFSEALQFIWQEHSSLINLTLK